MERKTMSAEVFKQILETGIIPPEYADNIKITKSEKEIKLCKVTGKKCDYICVMTDCFLEDEEREQENIFHTIRENMILGWTNKELSEKFKVKRK